MILILNGRLNIVSLCLIFFIIILFDCIHWSIEETSTTSRSEIQQSRRRLQRSQSKRINNADKNKNKNRNQLNSGDDDNDDGQQQQQKHRWILDKKECHQMNRTKTVDRFVGKLIGFGNGGRKFPESIQQIKPFCSETRQMINYIDEYLNECFDPDVLKLANVIMYTVKRHLRLFCGNGGKAANRKLRKLLKLMPCINENIKEDHCITGMMNKTSYLIPSPISGKDKIKYVCCYYTDLIKCGDEWLESIDCVKNDRELLLDFLRGLSTDLTSIACGDYNENSDRCQKLQPIHLPPDATVKPYSSFLNLAIDVVESMDSLWV